jgi:hypothetical protein
MTTQGYGRTFGDTHRVRYALGVASYASAPEPKPGHGTAVVLDRRTQVTHCYERSIAGLSEDEVDRVLSRTAELAQVHVDTVGAISVDVFAGYWQLALDSLKTPVPVAPERQDPMHDFLANFGLARGGAPLGNVVHRGPVGLPGMPTADMADMADPAKLATRAVAGAYDAALDYLARVEAETGQRVGLLRTAAPRHVVNIHRGMR